MTMHRSDSESAGSVWQATVERACSDRDFRNALLRSPRDVLAESGPIVDADIDIRVVEDDGTTSHLVIPFPVAEGEISDGDLSAASGGTDPVFTAVTLLGTVVLGAMSFNLGKEIRKGVRD